MSSKTFSFDIQYGEDLQKILIFMKNKGLSEEEALELLNVSVELAQKIIMTPPFDTLDDIKKNLLPKLLISALGPQFTREERLIVLREYPKEGPIDVNSYWNHEIKGIMSRFKVALTYVISELNNEKEISSLGKSEIIYYVVCKQNSNVEEEFNKLISAFRTFPGVGVQPDLTDPHKVTLFFDQLPFRPTISIYKGDLAELGKTHIEHTNLFVLKVERVDYSSVRFVKDVVKSFGMRVFSTNLNVYLPENENLYDNYAGFLKPEVLEVLDKKGYAPVFVFFDSYGCYCQKKNGGPEIYFINGFLLEYLSSNRQHYDSNEFAYKVSDNLENFVTRFDVNLIPIKFYKHYGKSLKIENLSYFDIEHIDRKVFVKPYILGLRKKDQSCYTVGGEDGGSLILMTKILKGETLDDTLRRFIKEDLKLDCDYVGAVVNPYIEFDLDREQKLTPRLQVRVYIDEDNLTSEVKERLERGWNRPLGH